MPTTIMSGAECPARLFEFDPTNIYNEPRSETDCGWLGTVERSGSRHAAPQGMDDYGNALQPSAAWLRMREDWTIRLGSNVLLEAER